MSTPSKSIYGAAVALSYASAALAAVASVAGLAYSGLYRDVAWVKMTWFGNDLITLLVGVPLVLVGVTLARRGSLRGVLLWASGLYYIVYNYSFYLHGAQLNVLFPLYAVLFVLPFAALVLLLWRLDADALAASFSPRTPVRSVAGYLVFTGVGLSMAWLGQWAAYVFGGTEPTMGVGPFQLVAAMDLTTVVPLCLIGGVLLWRRRDWGYILGTIMAVKGAAYTLVLSVNSVVGELRGFDSIGELPVWGVWTLAGVSAAVLLLSNVRRAGSE